jgi:hypothetical protein
MIWTWFDKITEEFKMWQWNVLTWLVMPIWNQYQISAVVFIFTSGVDVLSHQHNVFELPLWKLWWVIVGKCTNPVKPLNSVSYYYEVQVEVKLWPTVSWTVRIGVRHASGTHNKFVFLLEIFFRQLQVCYFVAPSLTRGRVCNLLYNCFWALPEQSLWGQSPADLTAIFYCLIWDSPNVEGQVPPRTG